MTVEQLKQKIREQRQAVEEFRDAIELLQQPSKYEPPNLEPLTILRQKWAEAASDKERTELLKQSKSALNQAEQHLESLEAELQVKESKATEAIGELTQLATEFNAAAEQLREKALSFQSAASKLNPDIQPISREGVFLPIERDTVIPHIEIVGRRAIFTTSHI